MKKILLLILAGMLLISVCSAGSGQYGAMTPLDVVLDEQRQNNVSVENANGYSWNGVAQKSKWGKMVVVPIQLSGLSPDAARKISRMNRFSVFGYNSWSG
jgi:hypothetical protein